MIWFGAAFRSALGAPLRMAGSRRILVDMYSAFVDYNFKYERSIKDTLQKRVFSHLSLRPKYFAYRSAQALTPPLFFINVVSGWRGFLTRATYRRALDHLLIVLLSALPSHVQRMTTASGSAFMSIGSPANLYARRISLLVRRRPL